MRNFLKLAGSIVLCELVGIISTSFTIASIPTWYRALNKPFFSPPNWVFGPVWTILYALMGVSLYLVWKRGAKNKKAKKAVLYFMIQLAFNFLWSLVFFGLHSPMLAFVTIVFLWITILVSIMKFYPLSKTAAYLLIPYIIWVSFASILNLSIVVLNR